MSPRRARRLLVLTSTALAGYSLGWFGRAWGWTPLIVFAVIAVAAWSAGYMRAWVLHVDETAQARRDASTAEQERDQIAARLAQLEDGGVFRAVAVHPAVRTKLYGVPKQAER